MAKEYIEREAFLAEQRHLYCENCERRKGMKNGKMKFVYDIGDAPCRACDIGDMVDSVEDFPAADVVARDCYDRLLAENDELRKERPVRHGRWVSTKNSFGLKCSECGARVKNGAWRTHNWCYSCGALMDKDGDGEWKRLHPLRLTSTA